VGIFLGPMLLFFPLQIPFWGVRTYFGWIIKSPWSAPTERRRMSFTLAHLLGWSAFLAIPLCILQAYGIPNISELFAITSIALTWCALVALLVYLALGTAIRPSGLLVAATLASLLAVAVQTGVIMLAEPSPTRLWEPATMLLAAHCSGTTVILVCLKITRWLGFRLVAPVSIT
jgi:hypothetical protein